jgi:hypothetical protein
VTKECSQEHLLHAYAVIVLRCLIGVSGNTY